MQNFKSNSLPINDFKYSEAIPYGLLGTYSEAATTASTQGLRDYGGSSQRGVRRSKSFLRKGIFRLKVHFIIGPPNEHPLLSFAF